LSVSGIEYVGSRDPDAAGRPSIRAAAGRVSLGSQVVTHGLDVHHDCVDMTFVEYMFLSVTGRRCDPTEARVLEQLWITTGYADARIWCNRIAGYLGSARADAAMAMSAALAASNSMAYGFGAIRSAYIVQSEIPDGADDRAAWLDGELAKGRTLHGYGRPVHGHDERIGACLAILAAAGLRAGPAVKRAFRLDQALRERKGIEMNIAGLWCALLIDFGVGRLDCEAFMLLMFSPGYAAVYADQRRRAPFTFLRGHRTRLPVPTQESRDESLTSSGSRR
jgi:citrate synthase